MSETPQTASNSKCKIDLAPESPEAQEHAVRTWVDDYFPELRHYAPDLIHLEIKIENGRPQVDYEIAAVRRGKVEF